MGKAKKARPRQRTKLPAWVKWIVAAAITGGIGYGLSQMSTVAYGEREIKVVDFSGLDKKQKQSALEAANGARCTCGCGMTLAQCVATDSTCPIREDNVQKIRTLVSDAQRTKS